MVDQHKTYLLWSAEACRMRSIERTLKRMSKDDKVRSVEKIAKDGRPCLAVCAGKHCAKGGTKHILRALRAALCEIDMSETVAIELTKCQDYCDDAPCVSLLPGPFPYVELTPQTAPQIVDEHVQNGRPVLPLLYKKARKRLLKGER